MKRPLTVKDTIHFRYPRNFDVVDQPPCERKLYNPGKVSLSEMESPALPHPDNHEIKFYKNGDMCDSPPCDRKLYNPGEVSLSHPDNHDIKFYNNGDM